VEYKEEDEEIVLLPHEFTVAESFRLDWIRDRDTRECELRAEFILRKDPLSNTTSDRSIYEKITIVCHHVSSIKLDKPIGFNCGVGIVMIRDIRSRQWEGANYEVFEDENEGFTFYCTSYTITEDMI
jgi:hypothetical protein